MGTSEWDARAIISYALIHHEREYRKQINLLQEKSENEVNEEILRLKSAFSLNSKNPSDILRKDLSFKIRLVAANRANNNHSDIRTLPGKAMKNVDLVTYSFPCQGLSIASMGRDLGINNKKSTSHLIWEIQRILIEAKKDNRKVPKYLLMENVINLTSKKHKPSFDKWILFLEGLGYKTFVFKLNGTDFGSVQNRKRIFALSIQSKFAPKSFDTNDKVVKIFHDKYSISKSNEKQREAIVNIFKSSNKHLDEIRDAIPKDTPSRRMMAIKSTDIHKNIKNKKYTVGTLTTKQDRYPNIGMLEHSIGGDGLCKKRFITTREAYLIMGFDDEDYDRVKKDYKNGIITKESLYRQAGNSIVVEKLEALFRFIVDIETGFYER